MWHNNGGSLVQKLQRTIPRHRSFQPSPSPIYVRNEETTWHQNGRCSWCLLPIKLHNCSTTKLCSAMHGSLGVSLTGGTVTRESSLVTSSPIHTSARHPVHANKSVTWDNCDVTGDIYNRQIWNSGELIRIVTLCVNFLSCSLCSLSFRYLPLIRNRPLSSSAMYIGSKSLRIS
jgi:hypothetical protein